MGFFVFTLSRPDTGIFVSGKGSYSQVPFNGFRPMAKTTKTNRLAKYSRLKFGVR